MVVDGKKHMKIIRAEKEEFKMMSGDLSAPSIGQKMKPPMGDSHYIDDVITTNFEEKYAVFTKESSYETVSSKHKIETSTRVPKLGVMLVGLGGNNGSTFLAGILANKKMIEWETK